MINSTRHQPSDRSGLTSHPVANQKQNIMTIGFYYEEFEAQSGQILFIEQYADKPHFVKFWRYGTISEYNGRKYSNIYGHTLLHKPRKKRLIKQY